ncbi:HNH endonuclease [Methylobacterium sp. E-045]|uniref:HNH endonuclease n=1 Tax=Methylobacterium sp. E-045 TaxID=2836575 RepID=UPI001FBB1EAB|nr:HNH endonuclease [Methylobacterium sp. E-045]MCJ2127593.1 HNH endonuclease [Methylobacterium sp. E-045]
MRIEGIKKHLKGQTIMGRKSTFSAAFASALAPFDTYVREEVAAGLRDLGQDPDGELECVYCGGAAATWDHVFSRVVKGEFSGYGHQVRNLVPCCRTCNEKKGKRPWRDLLQAVASDEAPVRAERIELFLKNSLSVPLTQEAMQAIAPEDFARFIKIRTEIFDLMLEADGLAVSIRKKLVASASGEEAQATFE